MSRHSAKRTHATDEPTHQSRPRALSPQVVTPALRRPVTERLGPQSVSVDLRERLSARRSQSNQPSADQEVKRLQEEVDKLTKQQKAMEGWFKLKGQMEELGQILPPPVFMHASSTPVPGAKVVSQVTPQCPPTLDERQKVPMGEPSTATSRPRQKATLPQRSNTATHRMHPIYGRSIGQTSKRALSEVGESHHSSRLPPRSFDQQSDGRGSKRNREEKQAQPTTRVRTSTER